MLVSGIAGTSWRGCAGPFAESGERAWPATEAACMVSVTSEVPVRLARQYGALAVGET